jgi:hypothetical protein
VPAISTLKQFILLAVLQQKLHGGPALPIISPKKRGVRRETSSEAEREQINANGPECAWQESNLRKVPARGAAGRLDATSLARHRPGRSTTGRRAVRGGLRPLPRPRDRPWRRKARADGASSVNHG